jgi:nitrite reductase/ring-hydroxylating ferredoxin subunit
MAVDATRPVLSCPWHGWQFDVATGKAVTSLRLRARTYVVERKSVPTYLVETDDERVYIDLGRRSPNGRQC